MRLSFQEQCEVLRSYGKNLRTFVETGTAQGETCIELADDFDRIYTIELDPNLAELAALRFTEYPHIECLQGDSAEVLPPLLDKIAAPCLFWLDGHYCGGTEESRGPKDTPIEDELAAIFATFMPHVILIDDARLFGVDPAYPTVEWVRAQAEEHGFSFVLVQDTMRITP